MPPPLHPGEAYEQSPKTLHQGRPFETGIQDPPFDFSPSAADFRFIRAEPMIPAGYDAVISTSPPLSGGCRTAEGSKNRGQG